MTVDDFKRELRRRSQELYRRLREAGIWRQAETWRQYLGRMKWRRNGPLLAVLLLLVLLPGATLTPAPPRHLRDLPRVPASIRDSDAYLLAQLVAAEAGDEPYAGQVAVAAVVLNRTRHPAFPKTVSEVVFEPWAFESVANGRIWYVYPKTTAYLAVIDAFNGWDPSHGALYFWNPARSTSPWIWSRRPYLSIGQHLFAR
ncbi:MAG: N-acetylmuramoyl-L-alanine amidase [Clostridia bacterium]|nr:N-acetylmuramoyl-L-alanine amidase [Clostridia bacterium]